MGVSPYRPVIDSISKFALRDEWRDRFASLTGAHLNRVLETFDLLRDDLPERLGGAFFPLLDFILEDFLTREFETGARNVVDDYLARRGWRESGPGKLYLQALRHSVVSLYEVTAAVPGSHFLAKDLVRGGAPVAVFDKLGSQSVVRWDRIAARVLPLGGRAVMSGGALPVKFEDAATLLDHLRKMKTETRKKIARVESHCDAIKAVFSESPFQGEILAGAAPLFTVVWLSGILRRQSGAGRPRLINFDGDEILFSTTRFPIKDPGQAGEIERRLERLPDVYREETPEPVWTWITTARSAAKPEKGRAAVYMLATRDAMQQTVLGHIRLESGALLLETNSVPRAERGRAMLAEALRGLVGTALTATKSVDQALAENARRKTEDSAPEPALPPGEKEAILAEFLAHHYRETLSQPLPMLDGKSPRQAVRSKAGRQRVAEWLKYLENQTAREPERTGGRGFDFGWMWEELKIAELRE